MRFILIVAGGVLLASLGTGCSRPILSPPARMAPLETVATVPRGDLGIQGEGGYHAAIFGAEILSGTARLRLGVGEDTELSGEVSGAGIVNKTPRTGSGLLGATRVGVKHRVLDWLALTAGAGAGTWTGGQYVSPDLGAIFGYENRYAIPFFSARASLSQPVFPSRVDVSSYDEEPFSHTQKPTTSFILAGTTGVRVPIGPQVPDDTRWSLVGGVGLTHLFDTRDKETFMQASAGAEVVF